jgi:hypothetical protein
MVGIQIKRKKEEQTMSQTMEQTSVQTRIRQLTSLAGFIASVLANLPFESVQYWLKNKTLLRKKLQEVFEVANDEFATVRAEWEKFYNDLDIAPLYLSDVVIPPKPTEGSWRLLFIPIGLTMNRMLAVMRAKFKVWTYHDDLDASVTVNTRTSATSYAVWVRTGAEPDEKYLGKSTRDADMDGKIGMTLLERQVLEVKHFVETGKYLDPVGVTYCTGSRLSDGYVPCMFFHPSDARVSVFAYGVDGSYETGGLRSAVSL